MNMSLGHVLGHLKLLIGEEEIDLGLIYLPLKSGKFTPDSPRSSAPTFGVGVDLDSVRLTIEQIFEQTEKEVES